MLPTSLIDFISQVTKLNDDLTKKRTEYREFIKKAAAHRILHLEERAEHYVLLGRNKKVASEVKRLSHIEQQKQDSRKIQFVLEDNMRDSATYILIPTLDEYNVTPNFDGNIYSVTNIWNRVQVRGGADIDKWVRVTDKSQIEEMLRQVLHFTQANQTPFTSDFWVEELAKDKVSDAILAGTYSPPDDLPWEACEELHHMQRSPLIKEELCIDSTFEEFCTFYRLAPEKTSSSPSGRHYGHFKALLQTEKRFMRTILYCNYILF